MAYDGRDSESDLHSCDCTANCALDAHLDCDNDCQVRRIRQIASDITHGQVMVAIATAVTGTVMSGAFGLALLVVWTHHAMLGITMPAVPWYVISIVMASFASGAIAMQIPRKIPVKFNGVSK